MALQFTIATTRAVVNSYWGMLCMGQYFKFFTCIISLSLQNNFIISLLLSQLCKSKPEPTLSNWPLK